MDAEDAPAERRVRLPRGLVRFSQYEHGVILKIFYYHYYFICVRNASLPSPSAALTWDQCSVFKRSKAMGEHGDRGPFFLLLLLSVFPVCAFYS